MVWRHITAGADSHRFFVSTEKPQSAPWCGCSRSSHRAVRATSICGIPL